MDVALSVQLAAGTLIDAMTSEAVPFTVENGRGALCLGKDLICTIKPPVL